MISPAKSHVNSTAKSRDFTAKTAVFSTLLINLTAMRKNCRKSILRQSDMV